MRDTYGRFVPGVSGNPGGRPRGTNELRDMVRAMTPQKRAEAEAILSSAGATALEVS